MANKRRILCIEDNEDTCEMLTYALKPSGYEVVSAHTGKDGLNKVLEESFDAILMDSNLPMLLALNCVNRFRESEINIPIIFYSGEARPPRDG
jgi:DNA-binding response OmpR family regulator